MNVPRYEIWGMNGNWRWRFRSSNGRIIASGESYKRLQDCENAVFIMQDSEHALVDVKRIKRAWVYRSGKMRK